MDEQSRKSTEQVKKKGLKANNFFARLRTRQRLSLLILGVVLVALIGGYALYRYTTSHQPTSTPKATLPCSDTLPNGVVAQAIPYLLDSTKAQQLKPVADKIRTLKDYDKDPNCLNITTSYYINISDYQNAKAELDKLERVYDDKRGFASTLGNDAKDIATLRSNVMFLKTLDDSFKQHVRYAPQPQQ